MKTIIFFILLILFFQKNVFALSLSEELTQLNNLYKEGAITKEEFSKAKSILLKSDAEIKANENIKKDEIEKIILINVPSEIYSELRQIFIFMFKNSGFKDVKINEKIDFEKLYKLRKDQ